MRARVAKDVKFHFRFLISACARTCKFLVVFMFHKVPKMYKDKIREKQQNSKRRRKTKLRMALFILPKCASSVNCAHVDRVTSNMSGAVD